MLERLDRADGLTTATPRFAASRSALRSSGTFKTGLFKSGHGGAFKFSGRTTGCFFAAVNGIAKHLSHSLGSANKMDLESVRLFFRTSLRINAPNV